MKTLVVSLYGGPGSGKSTGAAYIFAMLKMKGINAELVTEYAKDKVWEGSNSVFANQTYILGKQSFRLSRLKGKVDVIITDSPILHSIFYCGNSSHYDDLAKLCKDIYNEYENIDIFINRVKPYESRGRFQSEAEARAIDNEIKEVMRIWTDGLGEPISYNGDIDGYNSIVNSVYEVIKNRSED